MPEKQPLKPALTIWRLLARLREAARVLKVEHHNDLAAACDEAGEAIQAFPHAPAINAALYGGIVGDCFMVMGYGESEFPVVRIVMRREDLLEAVLSMIYVTPEDAPAKDREEYGKSLMDDDEWCGGSAKHQWEVTFEIGGVVVSRVCLDYPHMQPVANPAALLAPNLRRNYAAPVKVSVVAERGNLQDDNHDGSTPD